MSLHYLTTPIYYANGAPHLGHAFTSVEADILRRRRIAAGGNVLLTTGIDEHGQSNARAIATSGLDAASYLDRRAAEFRGLFDRLGVGYDVFVRTTAPAHIESVREFARRLDARGALTLKRYQGLYCVGCEQFKKPSDLASDGRCPDHPLLALEATDEENWFLDVERFRPTLIQHIRDNPDWIQPPQYANEVLSLLAETAPPFCISRPRARVPHGVALPLAGDFVAYVWFDALINYLSNIGWPDEKYAAPWAASEHLIGKDILKTHALLWPIMLLAAGLPLPRKISVHGHWLDAEGRKMSKTLGNGVAPDDAIAAVGVDGVRWFFARHGRAASDGRISLDLLRSAYDADLANKLGNLHWRLVALARKATADALTRAGAEHAFPGSLNALDHRLGVASRAFDIEGTREICATAIVEIEALNALIAAEKPWSATTDATRAHRAIAVACYGLASCLRALAPVLPDAASNGLRSLGLSDEQAERVVIANDAAPLFPRR